MFQEQLPLNLERIIEHLLIRHPCPAIQMLDTALNIRIPRCFRRDTLMLNYTIPQPRNRTPLRAVNLDSKQVISPDSHCPARVEAHNDSALKLEGGIRCIVRSASITLALLVHSLLDVRGTQT